MLSKKSLFRISYLLITVNLILVGFLFFNHFNTRYKIDKIQKEAPTEVLGSTNIPVFNPSYIMSNETFSSTRAFPSQSSVQNFLNDRNSPLRNYSEQGQPASYWIFAAARGETSSKWGVVPRINPGVLIAYLEKEQSLISLTNYDVVKDPQNRIRTAMGYGCPDGTNCDTKYYGLANQLNWGAYQLQFNFDRGASGSNLVAPYHIQKTITTLDEYNVFLSNAATAANYRYTPHVYWGNYNLWKIITANGWGVSSQTYSAAEIDRVNLANKDQDINSVDGGATITFTEIEPILKTTFRYGQTGDNITKLQRFLRQRGYYMTREINGMYGLITEKAHKNFNRDNGILNNQPSSQCQTLFNKQWKIGQEGQDVKDLQICLRNAGYFDWPIITGYYGEVTQNGLIAIRKALSGETGQPKEKPSDPILKEIPVASGRVKTVSKGVNTKGLNMRNSVCGSLITSIAWGSEGDKLRGPVSKNCFGRNWNWYEVQFGNQKGWVVDFYLENVQNQPKPKEKPNPEPEESPENIITLVKTNSRGQKAPSLNLRKEPCGAKTGSIDWGQTGEKLEGSKAQTCFGKSWNWQKVRFNGTVGWVADFYLQEISSDKSVKTTSKGQKVPALNIRSSACGDQIGTAAWGEAGYILQGPTKKACFGGNWDWYEVQFNGRKGWVVGYYLDI